MLGAKASTTPSRYIFVWRKGTSGRCGRFGARVRWDAQCPEKGVGLWTSRVRACSSPTTTGGVGRIVVAKLHGLGYEAEDGQEAPRTMGEMPGPSAQRLRHAPRERVATRRAPARKRRVGPVPAANDRCYGAGRRARARGRAVRLRVRTVCPRRLRRPRPYGALALGRATGRRPGPRTAYAVVPTLGVCRTVNCVQIAPGPGGA